MIVCEEAIGLSLPGYCLLYYYKWVIVLLSQLETRIKTRQLWRVRFPRSKERGIDSKQAMSMR